MGIIEITKINPKNYSEKEKLLWIIIKLKMQYLKKLWKYFWKADDYDGNRKDDTRRRY